VPHPSIAHFVPLFRYDHLPEHLRAMSEPFARMAELVVATIEGPEAAACLRKLLEAKDCAVRAVVLGHLVVGRESATFPGGVAGR
jgi:hypothetical protein